MIKTIHSLSIAAVLLGLFSLIGFSCQQARSNYYAALNACILHGGTWIPTGNSEGYNGACVHPDRLAP